MGKLALIIGNGFDLDLGLPSKYSDFIKSKEWQAVVKNVESFFNDNSYREHSLVAQLQLASNDSMWFDIEEEIQKFVREHPCCTQQAIGEIRSEFDLIRKALANYLIRVSKDFKADEKKLPCQLLYHLQNYPDNIIQIIFNYTYPDSLLPFRPYYKLCRYTFVHGDLKRPHSIVLGCDLQSGEKVNRDLSFMYKYNMLNKANHVARHLLTAEEIIFYGHSVNEMDFGYFREFFRAASAAPEPNRHLTMITYDEKSERQIKDNISNQGISVTDLYNNLWTFEFIHTSKMYAGDQEEIKKWEAMLERLLLLDKQRLYALNK